MIEYVPEVRSDIIIPDAIASKERAWGDIPEIIKDIIIRFDLKTKVALDLGVLFGYSTYALSLYFDDVIGVDTFKNNRFNYLDMREDHYKEVCDLFKDVINVRLIQSMWQDYAKTETVNRYDLIHLDMIHTYRETTLAGEWALQHTDCAIFHDTISNPTVMKACEDLAKKHGFEFYNYPLSHGLGILVKKNENIHSH